MQLWQLDIVGGVPMVDVRTGGPVRFFV
jgi:hypothetical protein